MKTPISPWLHKFWAIYVCVFLNYTYPNRYEVVLHSGFYLYFPNDLECCRKQGK